MKKELFTPFAFAAIALLFCLGVASQAGATGGGYYDSTHFTLEDANSEVNYWVGSGMQDWEVDGIDHLYVQDFWVRVGDQGGETQVSAMDFVGGLATNTNISDPRDDTLNVVYEGLGLNIDMTYQLRGGPEDSARSDVTEVIAITNDTREMLDVNFFQYSDFDLGNFAGDDSGELVSPPPFNTVRQTDPTTVFSETVVTPSADLWELALFPSIVTSLNDDLPTTLANATSPILGDVTWAFQWTFSLDPYETFLISKDKNIGPVPEPSTMILLGSGLLGLAMWHRRRSETA